MNWSRKKLILIGVVSALIISYLIGVGVYMVSEAPTIFRGIAKMPRGEMELLGKAEKPLSLAPAVKPEPSEADSFSGYDLELIGRMMIRTASIRIESENPEEAVGEVMLIAESLGGYVESMTLHGKSSAEIVIRVPEQSFFNALYQLRKIGKVIHEEIRGQDVTEEYVDLKARLRNLKAEEEWLLKAVEKAKTVEELLMIERELWRVRGEIERIEGRMRYLERRVEYSTIRVVLTRPAEPKPRPSPYPEFNLTPVISAALFSIYCIAYGLVFLAMVGTPLAAIFYVGYKAYRRVLGSPRSS